MDCPWKYKAEKNKPPYKCLDQKELKILPIKQITNNNSILLMWTTGPQRDKAMELIKYYGFTYQQTLLTWVKQKYGKDISIPGKYTNTGTEELLIATRGQVDQYLRPGRRVNQVQKAEVGKHSEKPGKLIKLLPQIFQLDKMNSLEIFARKRVIQDFDLYGDELSPRYQPGSTIQTLHTVTSHLSQKETWERVKTMMGYYRQQPAGKIYIKHEKDLEKLLLKAIGVFAFVKEEFGLTDVLQHHIDLKKDAKPVMRKPYLTAPVENEFIQKEIEMLLRLQCIEASSAEWAATIVLARKPNGDYRLCIDYRGLNAATIRDQYPLPRIDQVLATVCKGKVFSKLDLKSGFWQVGIYIGDRPKTSFVCKQGTFQWKRMPFGLTNAPATFQRLMEKVLRAYLDKFCLVYLDDVIIYSESVEEHLEHLKIVMETLAEANLKLGHDKCMFMQDSIEFLGHEVRYGEYKPLSSRVEAITKLQRPQDVKGIQIFLGFINYHGQFIPNLAKIAQPLRMLTRKDIPFIWGLEQQKAFEQLKQIVATKPVLYIPIVGKLMILYTDFSENGIGAVLSQQVSETQERVIEYASRTLKKHEGNYPAYKGEVLAVRWALQKFRQYLLQAPFRLVLDNESAVSLLKQRKSPMNLNSLQKTVLNWVLDMSEYEFEPVHRAGTSHNNADALSRLRTCNSGWLNYFNWWGADPEGVCELCRQPEALKDNDLLICDYCMKYIHQKCHKPKVESIPSEAWYCTSCRKTATQMEYPDITLDFELISYIKGSPLPAYLSDVRRDWIIERSQNLYFDRRHIRTKDLNQVVPTFTERRILLNQFHDIMGHCSVDALHQTLQKEYYWENMRRDVQKFNSVCSHCSQMNPKFIPNPYLNPLEKGDRPMAILHIDLSGDLQTTLTSNKNRYLMIIVDSFSKWVEIYSIPNKQASTTAACLWDHIKTFGSPSIVRSDKGTEFEGEFKSLLSDIRCEFIRVATGNPQANGQVERYVKTVKAILRKFVNSPTQGVEWDEAATAVQLAVNSTKSQTTQFSAYEILFGRSVAFPSLVIVDPPLEPGKEPNDAIITAYVKALKQRMQEVHPQVRKNILNADSRNKKLYDERHSKDAQKLVDFKRGDYVLIKIPKVTKLGPKGKGPFIWLKYVDTNKHTSLLLDPTKAEPTKVSGKTIYTQKTFTYNTNNLAKIIVDKMNYDLSEINFD